MISRENTTQVLVLIFAACPVTFVTCTCIVRDQHGVISKFCFLFILWRNVATSAMLLKIRLSLILLISLRMVAQWILRGVPCINQGDSKDLRGNLEAFCTFHSRTRHLPGTLAPPLEVLALEPPGDELACSIAVLMGFTVFIVEAIEG